MQSVQKDRPSAVRISCYLEPPIILFRASLFTCKRDECAVRSLFFFRIRCTPVITAVMGFVSGCSAEWKDTSMCSDGSFCKVGVYCGRRWRHQWGWI